MSISIVLMIISLSCLHISTGPDHYLPFIALAKSRNWRVGKTILWTSICGIGHIASSVIISLVVVALGWGISKISSLNNLRGNIAGLLLLTLGLLYTIWGSYRAKQNKPHKHFEAVDDGNLYVYQHKHGEAILPQEKYIITPWVMFVIFALAPTEPMIPLLSILGIGNDIWAIVSFVLVYVFATILTMVLMVVMSFYGLSFFKTEKLEKYLHFISGITLSLCGLWMLLSK